MGIKENMLVCLMDIAGSLKKISSELETINVNESKKQKAIKEATSNNNKISEIPGKEELEAMTKLFSAYYIGEIGVEGDNNGN